MSQGIIDILRVATPETGDVSSISINAAEEQDLALKALERAAIDLEESAVARAKTVALLSAGQDRIDRVQAETKTLLEKLLAAR
jgi:hypothetical protein